MIERLEVEFSLRGLWDVLCFFLCRCEQHLQTSSSLCLEGLWCLAQGGDRRGGAQEPINLFWSIAKVSALYMLLNMPDQKEI